MKRGFYAGKRPKTGRPMPKKARRITPGMNSNLAMPKVKRVTQNELKHVDLPPATYLVNTTPVFTLVNLSTVGTAFYQREYHRLKAKSLFIAGYFFPIRTIASTDYGRLLVVWVGSRSSAPTIAQLIASVDNAGNVTSTSRDLVCAENKSLFKVLWDCRVRLDPVTVTAGVLTNNAAPAPQAAADRLQFEKFIPLKDALVEYNDTAGGTIADFNHGSIYVVTLGAVVSGSEGYSVNYSTRFTFQE